jgi:hypothetical protein
MITTIKCGQMFKNIASRLSKVFALNGAAKILKWFTASAYRYFLLSRQARKTEVDTLNALISHTL